MAVHFYSNVNKFRMTPLEARDCCEKNIQSSVYDLLTTTSNAKTLLEDFLEVGALEVLENLKDF